MITRLALSARFGRDVKKLSPELQKAVREALNDLLKDPIPTGRRMEKLAGYDGIYTVHCTGNHSHKISFSIDGGVATLRRFGTHREIDDSP